MARIKLKRLIYLSILSSFLMHSTALAGEFSFGNDSNGKTYFEGDWIGPIQIKPWGYPLLGQMYYPDSGNGFSNNEVKAITNINYDFDGVTEENKSGLFLASGFYERSKNDDGNSPVGINENKITLKSDKIETKKIIEVDGLIELVAGYASKYAYGTTNLNMLDFDNVAIYSKDSIGLFGAFANQKADVNEPVSAQGNKVKICDSEINAGDYIAIYGASVKIGNVAENRVKVKNSILTTPNDTPIVFYGGSVDIKGNASDNTVDLSYSNLEGSKIYGGYTASGNATGNKVTVSNSKLDGSSLYGGYSGSGGTIVGNVLNIGEKITGKLNTIGGFNAINFENINWENGGTVLKTENLELVGGEAATTRSAESANTQVFVKRITGNAKVNDYMNLIVSDNAIVGKLANAGEQEVEAGVAQVVKVVTGNLEQETNAIKFTIVDSEMNPQVEALGEASAVANAFVANGVGLVEDSINAMMCEERIGYKTFAQMHGSNLDFDTPNDLSVKGWSGIVGVGETTPDRLTYGVFFETGKGDYHTLAQQSKGFVRGDGEVDYNGGGLLIRKDNENGVYVEASLRAGRMGNELNDAVVGNNNKLKGFDVSSSYYGAHIGIGKIIPCGERESLDVYGKFLYSYHDDDSFVIDDDKFNLDSVNSQRLRVGFRYNELNGDKLRMYYGLAYEYEFDAKARNSVLNYTFDSPDLGGGTVVGEIGFHYNADEKWCFDVNLKGYGGQREGFTGSVQANYLF